MSFIAASARDVASVTHAELDAPPEGSSLASEAPESEHAVKTRVTAAMAADTEAPRRHGDTEAPRRHDVGAETPRGRVAVQILTGTSFGICARNTGASV